MKTILMLLLLITKSLGYAQERTSNNDLRSKKTIFQIKKIDKKNNLEINLNSSISGQYSVEIQLDDSERKTNKVDVVTAQKLDDEFVDKFINFKYLMKERKGEGKCREIYSLDLRGESQKICADEKEKLTELDKLITKIKEKFLK